MSAIGDLVTRIIREEQSKVANSWCYSDRRLGLLELCRAIDSAFLGIHKNAEAAEFCREGANKALSLFIDESCDNRRTGLFPSDDKTFQWAHSELQHCGRIAVCEKLSDYECGHLGKFVEKSGCLCFEINLKYPGIEALEEQEFWQRQASLADSQKQLKAIVASIEPKVHDRMRPLVHVWYDHYIGHDSTPEIDLYFDQCGLMATQHMLGHDVFADEAQFGGLPFGFYRAVVWTLAGWKLKHLHFASILHTMHPELLFQNLLTLTCDVSQLTAEIADSLQVSTSEASQALALLEVNRDNASRVLINGHAVPPLIRAAREQYIWGIAGFLDEPFQFLLRNLRVHYESDWDRAIHDREDIFRRELYELLPQNWLVKMPRSKKLKKKNGEDLTDIDAVIIDSNSGAVGLFQLKWQDPFGHIMRERAARMGNFQSKAEYWVNSVTDYLEHSQDQQLKNLFECRKVKSPLSCYLFVLGRYFSQFSGNIRPDAKAVWSTWSQLARLAEGIRNSDNPILGLHSAISADSPFDKELSLSVPSFQLGDKTFTMELAR
jgi:hypothetical protein